MTEGDDGGVVVELAARRCSRERGPYVDPESCAAMMIACTAAAGGAPAEIVMASSPFMEQLVDGLRNAADHRIPFSVDVDVDSVSITLNFDGAAVSVHCPGGSAAVRMAAAAFTAVLHEWALTQLDTGVE